MASDLQRAGKKLHCMHDLSFLLSIMCSSSNLLLLNFVAILCLFKGSERNSEGLCGIMVILLLFVAVLPEAKCPVLVCEPEGRIFLSSCPKRLFLPQNLVIPFPPWPLAQQVIHPGFLNTLLISNTEACLLTFDLEITITTIMLQPYFSLFPDYHAKSYWFLSLECISEFR